MCDSNHLLGEVNAEYGNSLVTTYIYKQFGPIIPLSAALKVLTMWELNEKTRLLLCLGISFNPGTTCFVLYN
jgi:hypothetical protein